MDLTNYEIKVINMLFDSIFSIEKKKQLLLESDSSLYIDFAINGESEEKVYNLFNNAFELEHKVEIIFALYKKYGFEFKDIHELLENRNVLIFNYYDSNRKNTLIIPFSKINEKYLKDYKRIYQKYSKILKMRDGSIKVNLMNER